MLEQNTILIVDDTLESVALLADLLDAEGYRVLSADSGELALATAALESPNLILLDMHMPGLDGLEVCRRLKANAETHDIPVIFISSASEIQERVTGFKLGAVDFITKPFQPEECLARISTQHKISRLNTLLRERNHDLEQINVQLQSELAERKRAEDVQQKSEARFRLLVESSPYAIFVQTGGCFAYLNGAACDLFGANSPEDLLGKPVVDFFHPDFRDKVRERIRLLNQQATAAPLLEEIYLRVDGTPMPGEFSAVPIRYAESDGALVFARDITERKQAEQALRESEEKFRYVFDNSIVGKSFTSPSGELSVNNAFLEMLGYTNDEFRKQKWQDITYPEDIGQSQKVLELLLSGEKEALRIDKRYLHKNGRVVWGNVNTILRRDSKGKPLYFMTAVIDITERKQAEEDLRKSEANYRLLFENAADCIFIADEQGNFIDVNPSGCALLGYSMDELLQIRMRDLVTEEDQAIYPLRLKELQSGQPVVGKHQMRRKNGEIIEVESSAQKLPNGRLQGLLRDITARTQAEKKAQAAQAELQHLLAVAEYSRLTLLSVVEDQKEAQEQVEKLNAELEHRVIERTAQLLTSNKELEAFAYSVSHDLRAPLRAIDGFSRILEQEYALNLDDEGKRILGVIRNNTNKMDHLIIDLLALSRVSRSQLNFSPIDMTALANSVYLEMSTPEVREKFKFTVADLPEIYGDPTLIRQVWTNLISNAIKYTLPKEERLIEISASELDGVNTYTIHDSGVGFDPKYTDKLFGLFQRLHKANEFDGTGVGLAIVQRIIQRHGGIVWAEGQVDSGATFYFSIPQRQT